MARKPLKRTSRSSSRKAKTPGLYADALVYDILHDTGTGKQSLAEAKLLVNIAKSAGVKHAPLRCYEPACGSGRVLLALAKLGHIAIGSDIDPAMVKYANMRLREHGFSASSGAIVCAMEELPRARAASEKHLVIKPGTIDLAINPINSIRHIASDAGMLKHLRTIKTLLAPGGVYIVGLSMSMVGHEQESEDIWKGSRDGVRVTQIVQYLPPTGTEPSPWNRRERVLSHLTIARAKHEPEHRDSDYWLRTYSKSQWLVLVQKAGLRVLQTHSTAGVKTPAGELGYYWFTLSSL
jgi:SAM-dependent methyltransferase